MLDLPGVTLCCVDTVHPDLALRALRRSAAGVRFARTLLLTDRAPDAPDIELRLIPALGSREAYSLFILKSLVDYIATAHVLLIQWDGFVINPQAWRDEFLACDYIGAKWFWRDSSLRVGNGGFSLRSRETAAGAARPAHRAPRCGGRDDLPHYPAAARAGLWHRVRLRGDRRRVRLRGRLPDRQAVRLPRPVQLLPRHAAPTNWPRSPPRSRRRSHVRRSCLQLGRNCLALGQWQPAAAIFRRILAQAPDHAEAAAGLATASANAVGGAAGEAATKPVPAAAGKRYKHCHGRRSSAKSAPAAAGIAPKLAQALQLHERGEADAALAIYREVLAPAAGQPDWRSITSA